MLMNMKELLAVTDKENFAVPAFNICSFAMFNGIMDISEKKNAPVIIEIHPDELVHIGADAVAGMISRAAGSSDIKVAFYQRMREMLKDESLREPGAIEPACIAAMQAVAAQKFDLFRAAGKADRY
jgi:fructose/tagatose bisphosphate aldolase